MDSAIDHIQRLVTLYATATHRAVSTASRLALGSGDMITRLAAGHDITTRRAARTIQWLSDHWPDDLAWPSDIPRPESHRDAA